MDAKTTLEAILLTGGVIGSVASLSVIGYNIADIYRRFDDNLAVAKNTVNIVAAMIPYFLSVLTLIGGAYLSK